MSAMSSSGVAFFFSCTWYSAVWTPSLSLMAPMRQVFAFSVSLGSTARRRAFRSRVRRRTRTSSGSAESSPAWARFHARWATPSSCSRVMLRNTSSSMRATKVPVRASWRARLSRCSAMRPSSSTGALPKSV
ncbi:MAG: hypothetical protein DMD35_02625 [Gemmatimonadetes bacterium]|nr:MAG: hypothetical protein DMD35_02625 [Gemmatimonadota bacterium]